MVIHREKKVINYCILHSHHLLPQVLKIYEKGKINFYIFIILGVIFERFKSGMNLNVLSTFLPTEDIPLVK